ncbi:hypothetical protein FGD67_19780 [Colwellia sp. M166]|uniref:hypothetical protein n=1 Tax=Colwellia sp. M166 TaxID=2583805 RepID=UPI00211EB62C|nr:hypothetical protein [Colwellia sp. M166]UUO25196.1 hypothetical protein FGD67_19780 [Colwellia sp. M166]|tara:strand:+ start:15867 stop:16052 length:186 start_codon:yes stop_codon:yes gene_type:complete
MSNIKSREEIFIELSLSQSMNVDNLPENLQSPECDIAWPHISWVRTNNKAYMNYLEALSEG